MGVGGGEEEIEAAEVSEDCDGFDHFRFQSTFFCNVEVGQRIAAAESRVLFNQFSQTSCYSDYFKWWWEERFQFSCAIVVDMAFDSQRGSLPCAQCIFYSQRGASHTHTFRLKHSDFAQWT